MLSDTLFTNLGILGGGQLGRMLALAGHPLHLRCFVLDPVEEPSARGVAEHLRADFDDYRMLYHLATSVKAVTYEFENVPVETTCWLAERVPVFPGPQALAVAQDRIAEKTFFADLGVPVPRFAAIATRADLEQALVDLGRPCVLKTTRFGYDGKGQAVLRSPDDVEKAWALLGGRSLILEGFVPFERELSILSVRSRTGEMAFYPLVQNEHREGMLRRSTAPAPHLTQQLQAQAESIARAALEKLDYVGVLAIELFEKDGVLLVNEMAPRVHNSGHWTIEGAETSQFENHLRAVAGLPLGSTNAVGYSVMLNLIGTWPEPAQILALPGAHLHLYGKQPRPNRKLGHITFCGATLEQVQQTATRASGGAGLPQNSV